MQIGFESKHEACIPIGNRATIHTVSSTRVIQKITLLTVFLSQYVAREEEVPPTRMEYPLRIQRFRF